MTKISHRQSETQKKRENFVPNREILNYREKNNFGVSLFLVETEYTYSVIFVVLIFNTHFADFVQPITSHYFIRVKITLKLISKDFIIFNQISNKKRI